MANVTKDAHVLRKLILPTNTGRNGFLSKVFNRADLSSLDLAMARLTVQVMTLAWRTPRRLSKTAKSGSFGILIKHDQKSR